MGTDSPHGRTGRRGEDVVAKMRCMQVSSTNLKTGDTLKVTMQGAGLETQCSTTVLLSHKATTTTKSAKKGRHRCMALGQHLCVDPPCGFQYSYGTSGIPGDNTVTDVSDIPV